MQKQYFYYLITHPNSLERSGKLNDRIEHYKLYKVFIESQISKQIRTIEASKDRCIPPHVNKGYPILKYPYIVMCKIGMCCNVLILFTEKHQAQ